MKKYMILSQHSKVAFSVAGAYTKLDPELLIKLYTITYIYQNCLSFCAKSGF